MIWGVSFSNSLGLSKSKFVLESRVRGCIGWNAHGQMKQLLSRGLCAGECFFPAAFTLLLLYTHPSEVARNTKEKKKKPPVCKKKTNINCHQWSEQCYKSLLNHRMSMLRMFPFSLKPCVTGRDRCPLCSCPSCIREAWSGLSLLLSRPMSWQNNQTIQKYWRCWESLQWSNLVLEEEENERRQWMEWGFQGTCVA